MPEFSRYPVLNLGAEFLVMGLLMRRNILAYKAPPNNEGYDIICIHPNPRKSVRQVRVQVKSRIATDSDRGVLVKPKTIDAFDYLIVVYLNVGYFLRMAKMHSLREGERDPEVLVIPAAIARHYFAPNTKWGKMRFTGLDTSPYEGSAGIELIAKDLGIPYPVKAIRGA